MSKFDEFDDFFGAGDDFAALCEEGIRRCDEVMANAPKERPDFGPLQVREAEELVVGGTYKKIHNNDPEQGVGYFEHLIRIQKVDFAEKKIYFNYLNEGFLPESYIDNSYMSTFSLMPYEGYGTWQTINYIARLAH